MIDCPNGEIRDRLPDFVHGQLDGAARVEVSAHVADCAACTAELTLLRELRASLRWAPPVDVARIVAALPRSGAPERAPHPSPRRASERFDWRVAAAIVALAVGGGSVAIWNQMSRPGSPGPAPVVEDAASAAGVQRVATATLTIDADLADASAGELDALLQELESFDGLPAGEPESLLPNPGGDGSD